MKARLALLLILGAAFLTATQAQPVPPGEPATQAMLRPPEQLDQLLGPIALYPDALVALILPASTAPSDIVLASRYLAAGGAPEGIANQAWDESVKSLAHYAEIIKWMDDNLEWTRELGETFAAQPAEVMKTVQRLRAQALAAGTLINTPQQQIVRDGNEICIVPAQPTVIYVPRYDPAVVYVPRPVYYGEPVVSFGVGFAIGAWLGYECDWGQRTIWCGHRARDWRAPVVYVRPNYAGNPEWRHWKPSARVQSGRAEFYHPRQEIVRPRPFGIAVENSHRSREYANDRAWRDTHENRTGSQPQSGWRENGRHDSAPRVQGAPPPMPAPDANSNPRHTVPGPVTAGSPGPTAPVMHPVRTRDEPRSAPDREFGTIQPGRETRPSANAATAPAVSSPPVQMPRGAGRDHAPDHEMAPRQNSSPRSTPAPNPVVVPPQKHEPNSEQKTRDRDKERDRTLNDN